MKNAGVSGCGLTENNKFKFACKFYKLQLGYFIPAQGCSWLAPNIVMGITDVSAS